MKKAASAEKAKDYSAAFRWYRKAAEQGNIDAQKHLGFLYLNAKQPGGSPDLGAAFQWLQKPAIQGDARAQGGLGYIYKLGTYSVPQNYAEALTWLSKAADKEDLFAQTQLAGMYLHGEGVSKDYAQAFKYMEVAARRGDVASMRSLGMMHQEISGDFIEADHWFLVAGAHGDDRARVNSAILQSNMSLDQIQEAQRRASIAPSSNPVRASSLLLPAANEVQNIDVDYYARLFGICMGATHTFECARGVESQQMPLYRSKVRREGPKLTLIGTNGNTFGSFTNKDMNTPQGRAYAFLDFLKPLNSWLLYEQSGKTFVYLLVSAVAAGRTMLDEVPIVSPDARWFVTASVSGEAVFPRNAVKIYQMSGDSPKLVWSYTPPNNERPRWPRWEDANSLRLRLEDLKGARSSLLRVILKKGAWQVGEGVL